MLAERHGADIVAVAGDMGPFQVLDLAISAPDDYARILESVRHQVGFDKEAITGEIRRRLGMTA